MSALLRGLAVAAVLCAPAAFAQTEDDAGDVSEVDKDRTGPLRERVRPVSGQLFMKKGRFEFSPSAGLSLNDAFFTKAIFGGTLAYFPSEAFGVNLRFGYALPMVSGAAQICRTSCEPPTYAELDGRAPGQIKLLGGLDVAYSPIYGKVGLVAEKFLHFDLYALAGAAAVQYRGPTTAGTGELLSFGGNVGVGSRIVLNRWIALRGELRDLIYAEQNTQFEPRLRNQLMFELGLSFFFPNTNSPE